jgi:hypothetical protein
MRQYCKCSNGAELRAILMPLGTVPFNSFLRGTVPFNSFLQFIPYHSCDRAEPKDDRERGSGAGEEILPRTPFGHGLTVAGERRSGNI